MAGFTQSDCFRLKLLRFLETAGQKVLTYTLLCGITGKAPTETLVDYLARLPDTSTAKYKSKRMKDPKRCFDPTQKDMISKDTSWSTFDISLLSKAITVACEGWDEKDNLATLVKKIKDTRNAVVHETCATLTEPEFLKKNSELQNEFVATLDATMAKYNTDKVEYYKKKNEVDQLFRDTRDEKLSKDELLRRSLGCLLPHFRKEVNEELKQRLNGATSLDPLCFLSGHKHDQVDVQKIFSEISIREETKKKEKIHYLKLFTLPQRGSASSSPLFLYLEGDGGSGKSTFVSYTLSEYLKDSDRRMEGLDQYDLLLWIVCREETSDTLESLMKMLVPDTYYRYGNLLMPLMKHCNVLIVIDGLDEMGDESRQLVKDILRQARDCPKFTLLVTSRPEATEEMEAMRPKEFKAFHLRLEGVSVEMRTALALRHYRWLCGTKPGDEARLREVMQEMAWRETFRLPLNILFLTTFIYDEPQKLMTAITQTELYQKILDWCVAKLRHRIAGRQGVPRGPSLRVAIKCFLFELYNIALQGLLHSKLYITDGDLKHLHDLCDRKRLPLDDTLSAFYSLRRVGATDQYQAPHKGVQDFYAALHIHESINNYTPGDIRRELDSKAKQKLQLVPLRNMLIHLLGLFNGCKSQNGNASQEIIDLLEASGMKDIEDWLSVLSDTKPDHATVQRVVYHIDSDKKYPGIGDIEIQDGTLQIGATLLPHIRRRKVFIHLRRDHSGMDDLFAALHHHELTELHLEHHFRQPRPDADAASLLQQVPCRRHLRRFRGQLDADTLRLLPEGLERLFISLRGESLAQTLEHISGTCPHLKYLWLHVPVSQVTAAACLPPLPDVADVWLVLSGVAQTEVDTAVAVAAALCPRREDGYGDITFPGATLRADGWEAVLRGMKDRGVRVRLGVRVPDTTITDDERHQLNTLARSLLGCDFVRGREEWLWMW